MNVNAAQGIGSSVAACQVDAGLPLRNARACRFSGNSRRYLGGVFAAAVLSGGVAVADVNVTINPARNCLDTTAGTFPYGAPVASSQIAAGTYMVSLRNNDMSCNYNNLAVHSTFDCRVNTVLLRGVSSLQAGWGLAVSSPVMVDVLAPTVFYAFVVDTPCNDNTGSARLVFTGPLGGK